MSAHDRFESLAGAVMLGEASADERAAFDAHAATCALCGGDVENGALVASHVSRANASETWRPSQPIVERLHARRSVRARFTLGALGWAVALSIVLNVAFVSGIGSRVGAAFLSVAAPTSNIASTPITLESARHTLAAVAQAPAWHRKALVAMRTAVVHHYAKAHVVPLRTSAVAPRDPTIDDIPDVLAGVDLYGDGNARRAVAHVAIPRCAAHASDVDDESAVHPCRDAAGRIEREPKP